CLRGCERGGHRVLRSEPEAEGWTARRNAGGCCRVPAETVARQRGRMGSVSFRFVRAAARSIPDDLDGRWRVVRLAVADRLARLARRGNRGCHTRLDRAPARLVRPTKRPGE